MTGAAGAGQDVGDAQGAAGAEEGVDDMGAEENTAPIIGKQRKIERLVLALAAAQAAARMGVQTSQFQESLAVLDGLADARTPLVPQYAGNLQVCEGVVRGTTAGTPRSIRRAGILEQLQHVAPEIPATS